MEMNTHVFIPKIKMQVEVSCGMRSRDIFGKASSWEIFSGDGFSSLIDQLTEVLGLVAVLFWLASL